MKKVLVLAGGIDQIALIQDLKARGFYTILVDYYPNPVAKPYADKHYQESWGDLGKVKAIAKKESVDYICSACHDQALYSMAKASEDLGLPCYISSDTALKVTNKLHMKKVMIDSGIPTAKYVNIHGLEEGFSNLSYPLMVKPADSNSSNGVRKTNNLEELTSAFEYAVNVSRTHTAIVEEFKEGMEVSVDAIVVDGQVHLLMCSEIRKLKHDKSLSIIYQSVIPAPLSDIQINKVENIVVQIVNAFHLNNIPVLVQMLVNNDEINVIEFSARIGGGLKHANVQAKTGFNILHENINAMLGLPINYYRNDDTSFISRTHIYVRPGVFSSIRNFEELILDGTIIEGNTTKGSGSIIEAISASGDRVGNFLVKASTRDELFKKITKTIDTIQVLDNKGHDIFYRELYK